MRRILAAALAALILQTGGARAEQAPSTTSATAQSIIAAISARVAPSYSRDLRDFANAAMKMRGRERLRRLFMVETDLAWTASDDGTPWRATMDEIAVREHDRRYMSLADIGTRGDQSQARVPGMQDVLRQYQGDPDWMVRVYALQTVAWQWGGTGHQHEALALLDKARVQVPQGDPDAALMLQGNAIIRAYLLARIGDSDGVLKAVSESVFQYRTPEFPVGSVGTLELLAKVGVQLEDEAMTRSAYRAFRRIAPVGKDLADQLDDLHGCQVIEQTFGTPQKVLDCGKGRDFRTFPASDALSEAAYASRGLAYAQLGQTREAEQDAAHMRALAQAAHRLGTVPDSPRLDAWLDVRHGRAAEGMTKLEAYWKAHLSAKKLQFRKIVPQLTDALQHDLDLARRNEQQQSTIILFQWGMGAVAALICAAAIAVLMWQRRLNQKLVAANARAEAAQHRAEEANALKSQFLANVSHEVRTPLNGVLGMIQAMAADELNPVQRERLEVLRGSSRGMLTILNDLLDLAKIEAGKLTLENVEFDLAPVAEGSRHAFWAAAQAKGLALELTLEDEARGLYRGDPTRLRQVVDNLVSNAIKFTAEGGVHVTFASTGAGEGLRLSVRDTGIGMSPEAAAKIFSKFEQAEASTTRKYGGTGLGLSICRELVHAFGGEISVSSTPGQGTVFMAELPLARIGDSPAPGAEPSDAEAAGLEDAGEGLRILAAEDHPVNQLVLRTLLSQLGCEVTLVGDGAQAVEAFRAGRWDVVLMDIQMPNMDGLEATRAIRALERAEGAARTPLVALTANAMPDQIAQYREAGFDDHLSKPIDAGELLAVLNRALAGHAEAPELEVA